MEKMVIISNIFLLLYPLFSSYISLNFWIKDFLNFAPKLSSSFLS